MLRLKRTVEEVVAAIWYCRTSKQIISRGEVESPSTENQQIFPTTVFNHTWEVPNCIAREGGRAGGGPAGKKV